MSKQNKPLILFIVMVFVLCSVQTLYFLETNTQDYYDVVKVDSADKVKATSGIFDKIQIRKEGSSVVIATITNVNETVIFTNQNNNTLSYSKTTIFVVTITIDDLVYSSVLFVIEANKNTTALAPNNITIQFLFEDIEYIKSVYSYAVVPTVWTFGIIAIIIVGSMIGYWITDSLIDKLRWANIRTKDNLYRAELHAKKLQLEIKMLNSRIKSCFDCAPRKKLGNQ